MADPPVEIQDADGSESTFLFNVDDNLNSREANETVDSIYGFDSDETFIVSLEEAARFEVGGKASGIRISSYSDYSDDPYTALAEYAVRLMQHVNGNQGTGWEYVNSYTGNSMPVVIEKVDIFKRRSNKFQFEYSVTMRGGQGMMPYQPLPASISVTPGTNVTVTGEDMTEVEEMRITKQQRLKVHTYVTAGTSLDVSDNEIEARSGARREFTIRGNKPGDESTRQTFDDNIQSAIGSDNTVTFSSHFPGEDYTVSIVSHESTREAGVTQLGKYNTSLIEGGGFN